MTTPKKPQPGETVTCTVTVTETSDGLSVNAQIPDGRTPRLRALWL